MIDIVASRARQLVAVAVLASALVACSASDPQPPATASPEQIPETGDRIPETGDAEVAAETAAILDVFDKYVEAIVLMENTPQADPAPLYGIAGDHVIGAQVERVAELVRQGVHREGAPVLGEPRLEVDGSTALLEVCMDQDDWVGVTSAGQRAETSAGAMPRGYELELADGTWRVAGLVPSAQVELVC